MPDEFAIRWPQILGRVPVLHSCRIDAQMVSQIPQAARLKMPGQLVDQVKMRRNSCAPPSGIQSQPEKLTASIKSRSSAVSGPRSPSDRRSRLVHGAQLRFVGALAPLGPRSTTVRLRPTRSWPRPGSRHGQPFHQRRDLLRSSEPQSSAPLPRRHRFGMPFACVAVNLPRFGNRTGCVGYGGFEGCEIGSGGLWFKRQHSIDPL